MIRSPAGFNGGDRIKRYLDYYQPSYGVMMLSAGQFSPLSLFAAGEQGAWYDPSDFSTMFQDSAGTTPVTAVDQPVGKILDKSGRGNHATQTTEASRPLLKQDVNGYYFLLFDGTNDSLSTGNIDFSATDKMSVFAGVRKLNDNFGVYAELGPIVNTTDGTFWLGPYSGYGLGSRGTVYANALISPTAAPRTDVLTGILSISGDLARLRINSVLAAQSTTDQGTGNYASFPLHIGRRNGADVPAFFRLYSLIVRGALSTDAQIVSTETWVNSKTGAY